MYRDSKKNNKFFIKNGTEAKILKTYDAKFQVLIFTQQKQLLGKGGQGKCYIGILNSQPQVSHIGNSSQNEQSNEINQTSKYPIVVVKQIQKKYNRSEELYKRQIQNLSLVNKAQACNKNIVRCYPLNLSSEEYYYIVMEYCDAKSLDRLTNQRIKSGHWFNFWEFLKIFTDITNGYYILNKVGILHDDLKPGNIFIKGKDFKLGDFGFSYLVNNQKSQRSFSRGGTRSYNSIEKYQDKTVLSHKSDMYAIGIILFELFYGIHPYFEKEEFKTYKYNNNEKLKKLGKINGTYFKMNKQQQNESFMQFYQSCTLKLKDPMIKMPSFKKMNQNSNLKKQIQNLYREKIPAILFKLVAKNIQERLSFTELDLFFKQHKVKEILNDIQEGSYGEEFSNDFFPQFRESADSDISLPVGFSRLSNLIDLIEAQEIERESVKIPIQMLKTAGKRGKQLAGQYPFVFKLKQIMQKINRSSRLLIDVYYSLSKLDLKSLLNSLSIKDNEQQFYSFNLSSYSQNQIHYYEEKKIEIQFLVQKFLLSFLKIVINEVKVRIRSFDQAEIKIFYKENVDRFLQCAEKNAQYLKEELFITEKSHLNFLENSKDLDQIITKQLLKDLILDQENILFVYYCITILRIKKQIHELRQLLTHFNKSCSTSNQQEEANCHFLSIFQQWDWVLKSFEPSLRKHRPQSQNQDQKHFQQIVVQALQFHKISFIRCIQ